MADTTDGKAVEPPRPCLAIHRKDGTVERVPITLRASRDTRRSLMIVSLNEVDVILGDGDALVIKPGALPDAPIIFD